MEKVKEFISYGIVGVMTTLVNYVVYFICLKIGFDWLISNSLAWIVAVIFAYFSNRKVVFHSSNDMKKECIDFFGLRFITLLVENLLLAICIDGVHISNLLSKIRIPLTSINTILISAKAIVTFISLVGGFIPNMPMIFASPIYNRMVEMYVEYSLAFSPSMDIVKSSSHMTILSAKICFLPGL